MSAIQMSLPFAEDLGLIPSPKPPLPRQSMSSGAWAVYRVMRRVECGGKGCYPRLQYIADKIYKSVRSVIRWIRELVSFGVVKVERVGRQNSYTILKDLWNMKFTGAKPVENSKSQVSEKSPIRVTQNPIVPLYSSPLENPVPSARQTAAEKLATQQLDGAEIGGVVADRRLTRMLAGLLPTEAHWNAAGDYVDRFQRRGGIVKTWGLIVCIAEQIRDSFVRRES
jgi:hypothetical protein